MAQTPEIKYDVALKQLEKRYRVALRKTPTSELDPDTMLTDVIRWIRRRADNDPKAQRRATLLIRRLKGLRDAIQHLNDVEP